MMHKREHWKKQGFFVDSQGWLSAGVQLTKKEHNRDIVDYIAHQTSKS